eukprot:SAG31_NODE_468_length_15250_cov_5.304138_1_plen_279_part_00
MLSDTFVPSKCLPNRCFPCGWQVWTVFSARPSSSEGMSAFAKDLAALAQLADAQREDDRRSTEDAPHHPERPLPLALTPASWCSYGIESIFRQDLQSPCPSFGFTSALPVLQNFDVVPNADAVRLEPLPFLPASTKTLPSHKNQGINVATDDSIALVRSASIRRDDAVWEDTVAAADCTVSLCESAEQQYIAALGALRVMVSNSIACCAAMSDDGLTWGNFCFEESAQSIDAAMEDVRAAGQQGRQLRGFLVSQQQLHQHYNQSRRELLEVCHTFTQI